MTTELEHSPSTAGQVLRGLRNVPPPETPREAPPTDGMSERADSMRESRRDDGASRGSASAIPRQGQPTPVSERDRSSRVSSRVSEQGAAAAAPRADRLSPSSAPMTATMRFESVPWDGMPADDAPVADLARTEGESGHPASMPVEMLGASRRFASVPWDPDEVQQRRQKDYEAMQEQATKRSEKLKLKNFFGDTDI